MNSLVIINENVLLEVVGGGRRKRKRRRKASKTVQKEIWYSAVDDRDYVNISATGGGMVSIVGGSGIAFISADNDGTEQANGNSVNDNAALLALLGAMFS